MESQKRAASSAEYPARRGKRPVYEEEGSENFEDDEDDVGEIRAGKSWSSARKIAMVVSKFNELKRNLVRNIGFGGMLELPLLNKIDRKFTLWVLSRIDCLRRVIVVDGEDQADFTDMDVQRIIGIPCASMAVCGLQSGDMESQFGLRNQKAAEKVVTKEYPAGMDEAEMDKFKVAFVIFVVGSFLAPSPKYNSVRNDFLGALLSPQDINKYNWSAYVLDQLVEAASRVQADLRERRDVSNTTGCSLLVQIIYLESLNLGPLLRAAKGTPRIKSYDHETLRKMILADKASSSGYTDNPTWGCSQPQPTFAAMRSSPTVPIRSCTPAQEIRGDGDAQLFDWNNTNADYVHKELGSLPNKLRDVLMNQGREKLTARQITALRWFNASTIRHINQLKAALLTDQVALVEKLVEGADGVKLVDSGNKSTTEGRNVNRTNRVRSPAVSFGCPRPRPCYSAPATRQQAPFVSPAQPNDATNATQSAGIDGVDFTEPSVMTATLPGFGKPLEARTPITAATQAQSIVVQGQNQQNREGNPAVPSCINSTPPTTGGKNAATIPLANFSKTPEYFAESFILPPEQMSELMSFGAVFATILESESPSNKNSGKWEDCFTNSPVSKRTLVASSIGRPHWLLGLRHPKRQDSLILPLWNSLAGPQANQLDRIWIRHRSPHHIEIDGRSLKDVFCEGRPMTYEACDIAMRRLNQLDTVAHTGTNTPRWRHFLESDFAMLAIAGQSCWTSKSIRKQFIGDLVPHQLNQCRMVVVPALITFTWCCYIFDFEESCTHIVDPTFRPGSEDVVSKIHIPNATKIQGELARCVIEFYEGWRPNFERWTHKFVAPLAPNCTTMESGICALIAARDYDGVRMINGFSIGYMEHFKKHMLYEMVSITGNEGSIPDSYVQELDD